jgi:hypothetical protein
MKLRVDIEIDDNDVQKFIQLAYRSGWLREDPRRAWSVTEHKEAVRYGIEHLVQGRRAETAP